MNENKVHPAAARGICISKEDPKHLKAPLCGTDNRLLPKSP